MKTQHILYNLQNINTSIYQILNESVAMAKQFVSSGKLSPQDFDMLKAKLNNNIKKYFGWLAKQFVEDSQINIDETIKLLNQYFELAENRKVVDNDISKLKSIEELKQVVESNLTKVSSRSIKQKKQLGFGQIAFPESTTVVFQDDNILVLKIDSYEASMYYGIGTTWCITFKSEKGKQYWKEYYFDNNVNFYFILNNNLPKDNLLSKVAVAVLPQKVQNKQIDVYDKEDNNVSISKFKKYCQQFEIPMNIFKPISQQEILERKKNNPMALINACENNDLELVKALLKHPKIDVNLQNKYGWTALIWASANGNFEIVELLLKQPNIDVNVKSIYGWTTLMMASGQGKLQIVQALLKQPNIDVNLKDNDGWTALIYAKKYGYDNIAKIIEEYEQQHGITK